MGNFFLDKLKLKELRIFDLSLFYSIPMRGKKQFFRNSRWRLKEGTASAFLVLYLLSGVGICYKSKKVLGF